MKWNLPDDARFENTVASADIQWSFSIDCFKRAWPVLFDV